MKSFFEPVPGQPILSLNVSETLKEYKLSILAPGLQRSDIKVYVKDDKVIITNKKESSEHTQQDPQFSFSTFTKSFTTLHEIDADKIKLSYRHDMIMVTLVKVCRDLPLTKSSSHPIAAEI